MSTVVVLDLDNIDLQYFGAGVDRWDEMVECHAVIINLSTQSTGERGVSYS